MWCSFVLTSDLLCVFSTTSLPICSARPSPVQSTTRGRSWSCRSWPPAVSGGGPATRAHARRRRGATHWATALVPDGCLAWSPHVRPLELVPSGGHGSSASARGAAAWTRGDQGREWGGGEVRQPGCGGWSSLTRARHMGFASQVVGVEPARPRVWSRSSGASHRIRTTALESIHFSPTAFLRFLSFSIRVRTLFPPWETISIVSPLFPHLLAVMSLFLLMWLLIY
jgi:hypothetical protein